MIETIQWLCRAECLKNIFISSRQCLIKHILYCLAKLKLWWPFIIIILEAQVFLINKLTVWALSQFGAAILGKCLCGKTLVWCRGSRIWGHWGLSQDICRFKKQTNIQKSSTLMLFCALWHLTYIRSTYLNYWKMEMYTPKTYFPD